MRCSSWLVIFLALAGCKMGTEPAAEDPPRTVAAEPARTATDPVKPAEPASQALKLGEPVTAPLVSLSDVANNPGAYKGKTVATRGTVRAVCQERGCWMEITDTEQHANVRMHGHSFFVPKSSSGKQAKVQGTVVLTKDGKECEDMATTGAKLEFDATGVELL